MGHYEATARLRGEGGQVSCWAILTGGNPRGGGGATRTGPDATHPPTIFQNLGGGRVGGVQPGIGGGGGGCSCRGSGGGGLAGVQGGVQPGVTGGGGGVWKPQEVGVGGAIFPWDRILSHVARDTAYSWFRAVYSHMRTFRAILWHFWADCGKVKGTKGHLDASWLRHVTFVSFPGLF